MSAPDVFISGVRIKLLLSYSLYNLNYQYSHVL